jgi:four helix bundle protein
MIQSNVMFRFEELEIWNRSAKLSIGLFKLADELDQKRKFRFAEQLRSATLSITNNIAEGSGSNSKNDFRNFLRFARRSVFEVANILILLTRGQIFEKVKVRDHLTELVEISKMITGFMKSL